MKKLVRDKFIVAVFILFLIHLFFTFFNMSKWAAFDWDQVDNAWAAARIILAHKYPLIGMVAKQNSGMYIGPLYYYLVSIFYFFTRLDPIASPILAGLTRIFDFFVVYMVSRKLFNKYVALVATILYTFSAYAIQVERSQWPVNFVAPLSMLAFLYLYEIAKGNSKYFIHLGVTLGLFFNIHFTALFFPIIGLLSLPIIPLKKIQWKYVVITAVVLGIFLLPQIVYYLQQSSGLNAYSSYASSYYHGFHPRRFLQLTHDAFIKFQSILGSTFPALKDWVILFVPLFAFAIFKSEKKHAARKITYLTALWFLVPWIVFTTYSGEISDYYFNTTMYLVYIILAYLLVWVWNQKYLIGKIAAVFFVIFYGVMNVISFSKTDIGSLAKNRPEVENDVENGHAVGFTQGDPKSYLYFYYVYTRTKQQPYKL
jgi:4-amino-4-deoxy-L-arabinose transferase-like glycosyltransferase